MANSLSDLLKLTRQQLNAIHKTDIIDILEKSDSTEGNFKTLIDSIANLTTEITSLKTSLNDQKEVTNKQVDELKQKVDKQNEVIAKQQLFLEQLDRRERECNLVILGVPEDSESLDGATTDSDKTQKIWDTAGITCNVKSTRRLGKPGARRRPILAVVDSRHERDAALEKAKSLKTSNAIYNRIYIKKDVHPSVRNEWKRLHDVVKREKERPDNETSNIHFDFRERKVYKDNIIIDQWNMQGF